MIESQLLAVKKDFSDLLYLHNRISSTSLIHAYMSNIYMRPIAR